LSRPEDSVENLLSACGPEVVRLGPAADRAALLARAAALGWRAVELDGGAMKDKLGLMEEFARKLALPAYFGRNWDALGDCLTDPEIFSGAKGCLLVLCGPAPAESETLRSVLSDASRFWREQSPPRGFKTVHLPD
jgi:hypothetical protein